MRLGQLSRKVNVSYTEVLDYLENELDVHVTASLNAKVEDEYVAKVISHFTVKEEAASESVIPPPVEEIEAIEEEHKQAQSNRDHIFL